MSTIRYYVDVDGDIYKFDREYDAIDYFFEKCEEGDDVVYLGKRRPARKRKKKKDENLR